MMVKEIRRKKSIMKEKRGKVGKEVKDKKVEKEVKDEKVKNKLRKKKARTEYGTKGFLLPERFSLRQVIHTYVTIRN